MKKTWYAVSIVIAVVIGGGYTAAPDVDPATIQSAIPAKDSGSTDSGMAAAGTIAGTPVRFPLCTLIIRTTPESVSVLLDGTLFGLSPLMITNIDTGAHVILLQRVGYYQKKVALMLPAPGTTDLSFELSAPGRLVVITEPREVVVRINGKQRGTTPFVDSLIKPGTYKITLSGENYLPLEKTVVVPGGGSVTLNDTLSYTDEYRAAHAVPVVKEHHRGRYFTLGIVTGAFSLFLLILAIIEIRE